MASEERRKNTADGEGGTSGSRSPTASARGFSPANKGKSSISDPDEGHEMWRKCEEGVSAIMQPCFISDDIPRGLEELAAMHQKKTKDAASDKILDASALFQNDRREEKKMASEEMWKNTADGEGGASGSRSPTASARGFSPANKGKSSISDPDEGHEMWRKCEEGVSAIMQPCFFSNDIPRGLEELAAMHQKETKDAASDKILDASALFQNDRREEKKMASEERRNTADGESGADGFGSPTASAGGFSPANKGKSSISDPDEGHEMWMKCEEEVSAIMQRCFLSDDIPRGLEELAAMHRKKTKDVASDKILDASALFLATAVLDDLLSPLDLEIYNNFPPTSTESEILRRASLLVSAAYFSSDEAMQTIPRDLATASPEHAADEFDVEKPAKKQRLVPSPPPKMTLILDLDLTLLDSVSFHRVSAVHEQLLQKKMMEQDKEKCDLFRLRRLKFWIKLRPGIRDFLNKASELFDLHVITLGRKDYANAIAKLLDPTGIFFSGRITSREEAHVVKDGYLVKNLDYVSTIVSSVLILDDTPRVWPDHQSNLIAIKRYAYFPHTWQIHQMSVGLSPLETGVDSDDTLATISSMLEKVHGDYSLAYQSTSDVDVRSILATRLMP